MVSDSGDHRGHVDVDGHAGVSEAADGEKTALRMGSAGLQRHRNTGIQRRYGNGDTCQPFLGHRREKIEIADHAIRLGRDHQRMIAFRQHLDDPAGDPPLALDRLIGISVRSQCHRLAHVTAVPQFGAQQRGGIRLGEELRLKIQPGREIMERVAWPREAIDASVLASAIRVDRAIEQDIGRAVARDDGFRSFDRHRCTERGRGAIDLLSHVQPITVSLGLGEVEARAFGIQRRTAHRSFFRNLSADLRHPRNI